MDILDRLRSWARWTPAIAVAGLLSLALLPLFDPGGDLEETDLEHLAAARRDLEEGRFGRARDRMSRFLVVRRGSPRTGEAHFIQARALFFLGREGNRESEALLTEAWRKVRVSERYGHDPFEAEELRRSVAEALLRSGWVEPATGYFRTLLESTGDPRDALGFARSLAAAAAIERGEVRTVPGSDDPEKWRPAFSDGLALADLVSRTLPRGQRLSVSRALVEMYGRLEDDATIVRVIDEAIEATPAPRDRALLRLEGAKALTRLGRKSDALESLEPVLAEFEEKRFEHDVALLWNAEVLARDADNGCVPICENLIGRNSRVAPLAFLVLARFEREAGLGDWAATFRRGLERVKRPDLFDETGFRFERIHDELREIWDRETADAVLVRLAAVLKEAERIFPGRLDLVAERAQLWRRAGALLAGAAGEIADRGGATLVEQETLAYVNALERRWRAARPIAVSLPDSVDPAGGLSERYGSAADAFVEIANAPSAGERRAGAAVRDAADACLAGGMFPRAAALYRYASDLQPGNREENLYWNAVSLMQAGILGGDSAAPGALERFDEYVHESDPGNPRFALALLSRGRILVALGRRDDALDEFERLLADPALGIGPGTAVWAEALLSRGRTLLELAFETRPRKPGDDATWSRTYRGDAVRVLNEYLERYSEDSARVEGVIEANYLIARSEMEDRDWSDALVRLEAIEALSSGRGGGHPAVRDAWFLRGDLLLHVGRPDEARRAYDRAYRRTITSPDRLRGLIGRARANLLLGNRNEALRDYENGLSIYNAVRKDLDATLAGFGAKFFSESLQALRRELP